LTGEEARGPTFSSSEELVISMMLKIYQACLYFGKFTYLLAGEIALMTERGGEGVDATSA